MNVIMEQWKGWGLFALLVFKMCVCVFVRYPMAAALHCDWCCCYTLPSHLVSTSPGPMESV